MRRGGGEGGGLDGLELERERRGMDASGSSRHLDEAAVSGRSIFIGLLEKALCGVGWVELGTCE